MLHAKFGSEARRGWMILIAATAVAACAIAAPGGALARAGGACSRTAQLQLTACKHEVADDHLIGRARCVNAADADQRADCVADLQGGREEGYAECRAQRTARFLVCDAIGEDPYDPPFAPADFTTDFASPTVVNPYMPLVVGNHWEFAAPSAGETNTVDVLASTKQIAGVTCVVSRDLVSEDGAAKEFTDDWLAQAKSGDVVYCGEEVKDYAVFAGDVPPEPELVAIDGSFKVGRDGAKAGVLMLAAPIAGATYRQEYALGDAEDVATVRSTTYGFGHDAVLDAHVPQALADHLCDDDCLVIEESTPLEPDVRAVKYYAAGIGVFLEVELPGGEVNRLVACNVDPRCATLPQP